MENRIIINIGRQFGSGGRTVASIIGEKLGVEVYDNELILKAAERSGVKPEFFRHNDVGRAADYVLRDMKCLDVFVCAPFEWRRDLVSERAKMSSEDAAKLIQKKDKSRESWYNFFTFGNWGVASNYDLCLDSSILGLEGTADFIIDFARRAGLL